MKSLTSMRPFQLILLIVFVLFAFGGLYLFSTYKGFGGGSGANVGTVTVWGTLPAAAITQQLSTISTSDKAYGKVAYVQKQSASFDADLADAIAAGTGPDLILINQEQLHDEQDKISVMPFSSIPQRTYLNSYLPEFELYLTSAGTYGVPYLLDPLVLYYNKSILTSNSLSQPPATWEAVTGMAQSISRRNADGTIALHTIALGTYGNIENARAIVSLLLLQAGSAITQNVGGSEQSTLGAQSATADGVAPAQSALGFYTQFSDAARTVYTWNSSESSARQAFTAGDSALYLGFASELPLLQASNPNLDFDMAATPQPQTATQRINFGLAYAFAIPKASRNPGGAYLAAMALAGRTEQASAVAFSMAPANRSELVASPSDVYAPVYYPQALAARGWLSPLPDATDRIFSPMITSITSGQLTPAQAISRADQALTAAL